MSKVLGTLILGLLLWQNAAVAEANNIFGSGDTVQVNNNNNDNNADTGGQQYNVLTHQEAVQQASTNSNEAEKLNGILTQERPEYDTNNNSNGREFKADSAENDSARGKGIAIATGTSLIATGSAMLGSPIIAVRIAGANLVTKGTIELAQAAADAATEKKNGAQEALLRNKVNESGRQLTQLQGGRIDFPPEFEQLLTSKGLDPQEFANRAVSGELNDTQAVLTAFGADDIDFSQEDVEQANKLEQEKLNAAFAEHKGALNVSLDKNASLTVDENSKEGDRFAVSGSDDFQDGALEIASGGTIELPTGQSPTNKLAGKLGVRARGKGNVDIEKAILQAKALLANAGKRGAKGKRIGKTNMTEEQLFQIGIRKARPKQNIFFVAHRHYRNFRKWRDARQVAQID